MLVLFRQLLFQDPQLRKLGLVFLAGFLFLSVGLWRVQVLLGGHYQESLKNQSFRTVRLPAIRGKILDREGRALAENRLSFQLNLYLEDLRSLFRERYDVEKAEYLRVHGSKGWTREVVWDLGSSSRYYVASNLTYEISSFLGDPVMLDLKVFQRHYDHDRYRPMTILSDISEEQVARFVEHTGWAGVGLEVQAKRVYPYQTVAAHVLGHLRRDDGEEDDGMNRYSYRLTDYRGALGVEAALNDTLIGTPGVKAIQINNLVYRQGEEIWIQPQTGTNVVLTLDVELQREVERALVANDDSVLGAAVVMDVHTGEVLSLASTPTFDPNEFVEGVTTERMKVLNDPETQPMFNRATFGAYPPGSIFKIVVGMGCLEYGGLDPEAFFYNPGYYQARAGGRPIDDLAPAGQYDFVRAFKRSSNTYFIHYSLKSDIRKLLDLGHRLQLGKKTGIPVFAEVSGFFPKESDLKGWSMGDTANLSIGQGRISVTPLQMAVMTAAVANGGKVLRPKLVKEVSGRPEYVADPEPLADLGLRYDTYQWLRDAMRADVRDRDGSGFPAELKGWDVCGKTGTAEIKERGRVVDKITWFVSFSAWKNPQYAVVVMVRSGESGGKTCAPIARRIYEAMGRIGYSVSGGQPRMASLALGREG